MSITGLNTATYDFSKEGRLLKPKNSASCGSIAAFLGIMEKSDDLGCIVEESTKGSVLSMKATNIDTLAEATLTINYGGRYGYHAKVMLGSGDQVSVEGGSETAMRRIINYLNNPQSVEKKRATDKQPVRVSADDGETDPFYRRFGHLEDEFAE